MSVQSLYDTLYDFLVAWLTDADMRDEYDDDLEYALEKHDFYDVDPADIIACLPLIAEDLPPQYQVAIYEELQAMTDTGSRFDVSQGGGETAAMQGTGGGAAPAGGEAGVASNGGHGGGASPMDMIVQHIQNVTEHNQSWIDDRDVVTHVSALGDVDFDQILASGDGAIASAGDVAGVNTGTNNGIVAGEGVDGAEVTNVTGDGNVTGDFGDDATVVTGDDNVLATDSNVVDGDVDGGFIGGDVNAAHSALNFGDGDVGVDNSTDNSVDISDAYKTDNSVEAKDSWNTDNSVNDSGNTSTRVKDSFQDNDTDNSDNSTNTDLEVKVRDSFQDNDPDNSWTDNSSDWSYEEESHRYTKTVTETNTETNTDLDVDLEEAIID